MSPPTPQPGKAPPEKETGKRSRSSRAALRVQIFMALAGALLVAGAGYLALFRGGGALRNLSYDLPYLVHRAESPDEIRVVYIDRLKDGRTLDRSYQAALLDKLDEAGARAVMYDVIFEKPEPEFDPAFAAAMRRFRGVDENEQPLPGKRRRQIMLACGRETQVQAGIIAEMLVTATDELQAAADDDGLVAFTFDNKYTVRELIAGTKPHASLAWKMAAAMGAQLPPKERMKERWLNYSARPPRTGDYKELEAGEGSAGKDKRGAVLACTLSDVMNGVEGSDFFRNKIVLVGGKPGIAGKALGVDLFNTPFHSIDFRGNYQQVSGVELQATALANYLKGNWITRSSEKADLWFVLAAGVLAGISFTCVGPVRGLFLVLASIAGLAGAGIAVMHFNHLWFPWSVAAFLQVPLAYAWGAGARFYRERFLTRHLSAEQEKAHAVISKYVSRQMSEQLREEGFEIKLGGDLAQVAMMFTDLQNFTRMCQRVRDPQRIVATLNDYFERTTSHVLASNGVVIKYIGDAIFAAWGAPKPSATAAADCVRAAWELYLSNRLVVDGEELQTRVGLHFGEVVAGHVGSEDRMDYTMIGDAVNLSSRLEGVNKTLGTQVLLSGELRELAGDEFRYRKVGCFKVVGRDEATEIYELLGPLGQEEEPPWLALYHRALDDLAGGDIAAAQAGFTTANESRSGGDGPSRFFLGKIAGEDESTGIGEGGVVSLTEK